MKRYSNILLCLCFPLLMFLTGCLDEDVRTIVNADGSSERIYSVQISGKEFPESGFPRPYDGSWTIRTDSNRTCTARKKFATPEALSNEYAGARDTGIVGLNVSINKRFEWFYTYLDYRETYVMRNRLVSVPVTDFMTKDEIDRYVRGDTSDALKHKVDAWDYRNMYEAFFAELVAETQRRNDRELPPALLNGKKEEFYRGILVGDSINTANKKKDGDTTKKGLDDKYILDLSVKVFGTNAILKYEAFADTTIKQIAGKQDPGGHPDNWSSSVQMPGILLATNSASVEGNSASWKFASKQIHVGEYVMTASSRVTNVWTFIVTGIVALMVVALGVVRMAKRRR